MLQDIDYQKYNACSSVYLFAYKKVGFSNF